MAEDLYFVPGKEVRLVWTYEARQYVHTARIASASAGSLFFHPPYDQWEHYPFELLSSCSLFVTLAEGEAEYPSVWESMGTANDNLWVVRYPRAVGHIAPHGKRHYRVPLTSPMWYCMFREVRSIPIEYPLQGEIVNLTHTGMRVVLPTSVPQNEAIEVVFNIVPHRMLIGATVAYIRPIRQSEGTLFEAVLRFVGLSPLQRDRIAYYISQQSPCLNEV